MDTHEMKEKMRAEKKISISWESNALLAEVLFLATTPVTYVILDETAFSYIDFLSASREGM